MASSTACDGARRRAAAALGAAALLTACAPQPAAPDAHRLIPDVGEARLAKDLNYGSEELALAPVTIGLLAGIFKKPFDQLPPLRAPAMLYFIYQPFAPNWHLEEARLSDDTYYFRLVAKRFRTGGDGEALSLVRERAALLQHARAASGYQILEYSEGIHSSTPLAQRYTHAIVRLLPGKAALAPSPE